jgi:hypothetical protein
LPDEFLGKKVRCARCSTVFEAQDSAAVPPAAAPRPAGIDMDLSLDDPDDRPRPAAPRGSRPVGAVEIDMTLDSGSPSGAGSPASPPESEPAPPERSEKQQSPDLGDKIRCPVCRRSNEQAARRCYHCGERLRSGGRTRYPDRDEYDDDHGFRRRRRDTEPHRGGVVLAMGIISLVGIVVIPVVPIIFGIIGWVMGHSDLRKMRNNQMDNEGEGTTRAGWICSIIGTLLNGTMMLLCCGFYGFIIMAATNAPRTTRTWTAPPVPAKAVQPKDWNARPNNDKGFKDFEQK